MAKKNSPILDLSTAKDVKRDYVLIDGDVCELRSKSEITLRNYARLQKEGRKILSLYVEGNFEGDQLQELVDAMEGLLELIFVDVSKETIRKLSDIQQFQIIETFIELLSTGLPKGAKEAIEAEKAKIEAELKATKDEAPEGKETVKKKKAS